MNENNNENKVSYNDEKHFQNNSNMQGNLNQNKNVGGESKAGIGVLCALLLGLIGLLIGYLLYKDRKLEYEWQTFLKAWIWTYVIEIAIAILIFSFYLFALNSSISTMNSMY